MKLKDIVKEIEEVGKNYRNSESDIDKETYDQYIELMIAQAEKTQQYNLCDYWERLKI